MIHPLWHGSGCKYPNNRSMFNGPPWFYKEFLETICTSDDNEMRMCRDMDRND